MRTTVYAIRDKETKIRLTYRYRDRRDVVLFELPKFEKDTVEIYRTTQDLPPLRNKRTAMLSAPRF